MEEAEFCDIDYDVDGEQYVNKNLLQCRYKNTCLIHNILQGIFHHYNCNIGTLIFSIS